MKKVFDDPVIITQNFGERPEYYAQWNFKGHEGIDMVPQSRKSTAPIYAVESGVVVRDTDDPLADPPNRNYGKKCVIWNSQTRRGWWYCHLSKNDVSLGQRMNEGDKIGNMGCTGNCSGAHLHLGCRETDDKGSALNVNNGYKGFVDPLPFLEATPQPEHTNVGNALTIDTYKKFVDDLIEVSRPPMDKRDIPSLVGWIGGLKSAADQLTKCQEDHRNFVQKVADLTNCTETDESAVLDAVKSLSVDAGSQVQDDLKKYSAGVLLVALINKVLRRG